MVFTVFRFAFGSRFNIEEQSVNSVVEENLMTGLSLFDFAVSIA